MLGTDRMPIQHTGIPGTTAPKSGIVQHTSMLDTVAQNACLCNTYFEMHVNIMLARLIHWHTGLPANVQWL